jgi:hypothetical protein
VAVVAAAGLRWLLARFDAAITAIRIALASMPRQLVSPGIAIPVWGHADRSVLLRSASGASLAKRGPPSFARQLELN